VNAGGVSPTGAERSAATRSAGSVFGLAGVVLVVSCSVLNRPSMGGRAGTALLAK
jgi:hypothetical protein